MKRKKKNTRNLKRLLHLPRANQSLKKKKTNWQTGRKWHACCAGDSSPVKMPWSAISSSQTCTRYIHSLNLFNSWPLLGVAFNRIKGQSIITFFFFFSFCFSTYLLLSCIYFFFCQQNMEIHLKIKKSKRELEALENQEKEVWFFISLWWWYFVFCIFRHIHRQPVKNMNC